MHVRLWHFLRSLTRLVVEEATRTFLEWIWRKQPRQRRPWQHRRKSGDSLR